MRDNAILNGEFNIFSTTAMTPMQDGQNDKVKWPMFAAVSKRPEGEKNNVHKHDTFLLLDQKNGKYTWRSDLSDGQGKDRGRELVRGIDYTDIGIVASYLDFHSEE